MDEMYILMPRNAGTDENGRFDGFLSNWRFLCKLHHGLTGPDNFDEFLSNACSDKNDRFDEILSNWRSLCKLHHGLSGVDDFDKFLSKSSKHNLLGGNDDFDEFLSHFACQKWRSGFKC